MGTMLIIAEIVGAIWKHRNYRKKSINDVLASMQRPEKGVPISDLYPNRSNIDKDGTELNSSDVEMETVSVEMEPIPIEEEPSHSEKKKMVPKNKP